MPAKAQQFVIKGMKRDLSPSKFDPNFAYENHNIRITARDSSTLLSVTNEKGNLELSPVEEDLYIRVAYKIVNGSNNEVRITITADKWIEGTELGIRITGTRNGKPYTYTAMLEYNGDTFIDNADPGSISLKIVSGERVGSNIYYLDGGPKPAIIPGVCLGYCTINNYLTIFSDSIEDEGYQRLSYIIRLEIDDLKYKYKLLYRGGLNFNKEHPIETLGIFENKDIQKVYWVDGINQPRVINIVSDKKYSDTSFDFIQPIGTNGSIAVERSDSPGIFSAGTIQYAFSYFNLYGAETSIAGISSLNYISLNNRAPSPEEKVNTSFKVSISGLIEGFDYIRVYSIQRTSPNAIPLVKRILDIPATNASNANLIDTGSIGDVVDPTLLLYIGGESITPYTMSHKDNTLFFGNYSLNKQVIDLETKALFKGLQVEFFKEAGTTRTTIGEKAVGNSYVPSILYPSSSITSFKSRDYYRFGIQLQYETGQWSEAIYIGDFRNGLTMSSSLNSSYYDLIKARVTIPQSILDILKEKYPKFKRIRGLVVYPDIGEREVIAQGLVSDTVSCLPDRKENAPFCQASWKFLSDSAARTGPCSVNEIQGFIRNKTAPITVLNLNCQDALYEPWKCPTKNINELLDSYPELIVSEQRVVTLNSPDIELGNISNIDLSSAKFRIIGEVSNTRTEVSPFDQSITSSTPALGASKGLGYGTKSVWVDSLAGSPLPKNFTSGADTIDVIDSFSFSISTWQRTGSLNNSAIPKAGEQRDSVLDKHKSSSYSFYGDVIYYTDNLLDIPGDADIQIASSEEEANLKLNVSNTDYGITTNGLNYRWNIDRVLSTFIPASQSGANTGYPIQVRTTGSIYLGGTNTFTYDGWTDELHYDGKYIDRKNQYFNDPISIKYKSSPHAVIAFKDNKYVKHPGSLYPILVGEIYRDVNTETIFGGRSEEALLANKWIPAGPAIDISTLISPVVVEFLEGDTYFQRFESLKTYPYTLEDKNSFTCIGSFLCESYTNTAGRYDKNIRANSHLVSTPKNFNLINPAYTQANNYFTYRSINPKRFSLSSFPNQILWTKTKVLGEEVDSWTNLVLSSTLDLDGDRGSIEAIRRYNNELYCFQPLGISRIYYNSRAQMITEGSGSGSIPVELTNTGKVEGKSYVTTNIGSSNKWSIVTSPNGMYFIDDLTSSLFLLNQDGPTDLSDKLSFRTWVDKVRSPDRWTPDTINGFKGVISFYDATNSDVYFITRSPDTTVCFSELLGQFVSFFNYDNVPFMFNANGEFYSVKDIDGLGVSTSVWKQDVGPLGLFYSSWKPSSIEIIVNSDQPIDKIFNTIEWRDTLTLDGGNSTSTFDTVRVQTDYQDTGEVSLVNVTKSRGWVNGMLNPVTLRRKFRAWRVPIPRDKSNHRDRIRGSWAKVKLEKSIPDNTHFELHDVVIHYFE